ncbi:MAG: flavin reductase family protein [Dehalococcoidia bacterium]|nr:flavin reductase family protein [Dehalococcoidia bacterium]MDD5493419.1 flavin reductase family protein [Dehalococcoidia bacterium]
MLKVVAEHAGAFYQHYPRVAAIVTASSGGRKNAMAVAWHSSISFKPPVYGISIAPKRYTYQLISESKQFGINFVPYEKAEMIAAVGGSSGNMIDKFSEFNIAEDKSIKTEVPILRDAYAAYECKVIDNKVFGDHAWIIGEIIAVHVAEGVFRANGMLDLSQVHPALYLGGETYCSTDVSYVKFLDREKYGKK